MARSRLTFEPIHADPGSSFFCRSVQGAHFGFGWHHHPEIEVAWVQKGHGRRYVGDSIEDFAEDDLVLLGSDVPHTWVTDPRDGPVASKVIQFLPSIYGNLISEAPELRALNALMRRAERGLHLTGATASEVMRLFLRIHDNRAHSWRQVADLIALLGVISESSEARELASGAPRPALDESRDRTFNQVLELMQGDPGSIPSQAEAARRLSLSPASFSRFFRARVGKTYAALATEVRLVAACRELIETDRAIIDIAFRSGFENLSNFNRRFRAIKGMTPREFRAQARRAESIFGPNRAS
jgi:AraC-like DNA-binding protein